MRQFGVSEFLRDGENAILVDPDSDSAIISGIKKALANENLRERIAKGAAIDARRYTLEEMARKILEGIHFELPLSKKPLKNSS